MGTIFPDARLMRRLKLNKLFKFIEKVKLFRCPPELSQALTRPKKRISLHETAGGFRAPKH